MHFNMRQRWNDDSRCTVNAPNIVIMRVQHQRVPIKMTRVLLGCNALYEQSGVMLYDCPHRRHYVTT